VKYIRKSRKRCRLQYHHRGLRKTL